MPQDTRGRLRRSEGTPQYAAVSGNPYWDSESCGIGIDINSGIIDGRSYVITLYHLSSRSIADASRSNAATSSARPAQPAAPPGRVHFQVAQDGAYIDPMSLPALAGSFKRARRLLSLRVVVAPDAPGRARPIGETRAVC